ncbi:MAG: outer membrane beta-barrel protein [Spirochaetes bacterium]|mgnify:CR=1 FL=1|nr:outer membrane beta-barrel protein [Spirochaetota bacterium]
MKQLFTTVTIFLLLCAGAFAQPVVDDKAVVVREKNVFVNPSDNEFMGKIGMGYAFDPGRFGLDLSFNYVYNLDPYFVVGLEADFFWVSWENKLGDVTAGGGAEASLKAETNMYNFPVFANAQLRLPFLRQKIYFEPFITVGLGYNFMILDYTSDVEDGTDFFSGFAWQMIFTAAYRLPQGSAVDFLLDLGYRGMKPQKGNVEIDMSGPVMRLGVRLYI